MATDRSALNGNATVGITRTPKIEHRPERLLTAQEVAEWLGVSNRWVLSHAAGLNRPVLPSVKLGKAVRFERGDVEEFIRQCARQYRAG
jgi:excisionase family DNA binding protein